MYNRGVALLDLERAADALAMFDAVTAAYQNNAEMLEQSRPGAVESEAPSRGAGQL